MILSPLIFTLNKSDVIVSWANSFQLNGPLETYILWVGNNKQLLGSRTTYRHPRETEEAIYVFEVEARTSAGSVRSAKTVFDVSQPNFYGQLPTSPPPLDTPSPLHQESWFIALLVLLSGALLIGLVVLAIRCHARRHSPYVRERQPLQPRKPMVPLPPTPLDNARASSKGRGKVELGSSVLSQCRNPAYMSSTSVLDLTWEHDSTSGWEPAALQYDSAFNSLVYEGEDSIASSLPPKLMLDPDPAITDKNQMFLTDTHI